MAESLMTSPEVDEYVKGGRGWANKRRHAGDGPPYIRISRFGIRYRREDVDRWLDERRNAIAGEHRRGRPRRDVSSETNAAAVAA